MLLNVKRLRDNAILPTKATEGSACFDLYSTVSTLVPMDECVGIPTGLAFEVPEGFAMMIYSRSGHGFKHGIRLGNAVGVVDSDYVGEVMVALYNDSMSPFRVNVGDRIAQFKLERVYPTEIVVVDELGTTARGAGGFGSTGA